MAAGHSYVYIANFLLLHGPALPVCAREYDSLYWASSDLCLVAWVGTQVSFDSGSPSSQLYLGHTEYSHLRKSQM